MFAEMNVIVIDVIFVVLLLTFIAIGAFRGITHTSINTSLLVGSVLLSFTSLTGFIKEPIAKLLAKAIDVNKQIGIDTYTKKVGLTMFYNLMAAIILTILIYLLLRLIKFIICLVIKKKRGITKENARSIKPVSRVCAALVSFLVNSVMLVLFVSALDTPLTGLDKKLDESYVTQHVVRLNDSLIKATGANVEEIKDQMAVKLLKADFFMELSVEELNALDDAKEVVLNGLMEKEDVSAKTIQEYNNQLNKVLVIYKLFVFDEDGNVLASFKDFSDVLAKEVYDNVINLAAITESPYTSVTDTNSTLVALKKVCKGKENLGISVDKVDEAFKKIVSIQ